jgi:hypothetical protein
VLANFALATAATFWLMLRGAILPMRSLLPGALLVLATIAALAGLVERRPWARPLDTARWLGLAAWLLALAAL